MDALTGQDEKALLAQLAEAREKLDQLVDDLRAIDGELEELSVERERHRLMFAACSALEQLGEIGGAGLFWGDRAAAESGEAQLLRVRSRVEGFEKLIGEIDDRRQAVLDEMAQHEDGVELLERDVRDAQDEQDRLDEEWIIDREMNELPARDPVMPWARGGEEDQRYRKSLASSLAVSILIMLIEIPLLEPSPEPAVPERLTRLIAEKRPLPPREEPKPELSVPKESPLVAEEPAPQKKKEGPSQGTGEGPSTGAGKGLLAFREQLGVSVNQQLSRLGAQAHVTNAGAASGAVERSMITSNAPGSSGGINLAELSRGVNGGGSGGGASAIAGVQIARATSNIAGGGGGRGAGQSVGGNGVTPGRTDEEIQIVFDRHKAALYRLYNRELRRDPNLKGQMILRLKIEPDGSVSLCELRGTDMNAPQLAAEVVDRVRGFDFGAKEGIGAVTILYPIDFLPAA